jgi:hypothetical protein
LTQWAFGPRFDAYFVKIGEVAGVVRETSASSSA